ncbi:MAG: hypothetical protein ACOZBH_04470 [Patescibacteria group bacterium]
MTKTIEVSNETFELIKDQLGDDFTDDSFDELVGKKVFMRTVTYHMLGEVKKKVGNFLLLKDASWVADSKRFSDFIKKGVQDETPEIEPVGEVMVNMDSVVDLYIWKHKLPTKQQ